MGNKDEYSGHGDFWNRSDKKIQSDFVCRPQAVQLAGNVRGKSVADIGCGEGYVSRILSSLGANVIGIDQSPELIAIAKQAETRLKQGIEYHVADATQNFSHLIPKNSQDLAFSICVTPHLKYQEMIDSFRNTANVLADNGEFILAVPHSERFLDRAKSNWWTFDYDKFHFKPDVQVPITLYTGDGKSFSPMAYPHSAREYGIAIRESGFRIKEIISPLATEEDLKVFPERWGEESTLPFYAIFKLVKKGSK